MMETLIAFTMEKGDRTILPTHPHYRHGQKAFR